MNEQWNRSGMKATVYLRSQEVLVAWIIHEDTTKVILSLDPGGRYLRTVFRRDIVQLMVDETEENWIESPLGTERLGRLRHFEPALEADVEPMLDRIDYKHLIRNAKSLRQIADAAGLNRPEAFRETAERQEHQLEAQILFDSLALANAFLDEAERTGLLPFVFEHHEILREITHEETLPAFDANWAGAQGPDRLINTAQTSNESIADTKALLSIAKDRGWRRADSARWFDGAGDIVLGAGFATANIALGAVAGIVGSLPTLGIGTVAAVVGVTTSTFTGLTTLKKGLVTLIQG